MIYFLIIFLLIFFIYVYDINNIREGKELALFLILLFFIITAGLSYRVGIDAIRYSEDFLIQPKLSQLGSFDFSTSNDDPLWVIFSSIFRSISSEFFVLHFVHATIVNSLIFYYIHKYSKKPFTAILLYFLSFYLFFNFETLRESLAVAIFLLTYESLQNKHWIKYYCIATIAFFIHSSASVTFLIPVLLSVTKIRSWMPLVIIGLIFIILGRYINEIVLGLLPMLTVNERIVYKLGVYFGRDEIGISIGIFLKNVFFPIVLLMIDKFIIKATSKFTPITKLFLILGVISMVIPVVDRLLNYVIVFYVIHLSESIYSLANLVKERAVKFIFLNLLIVIFTFAPISWIFTLDDRISEYNYNRYFPYTFIFFGEKVDVREKFYRNGS